MFALTLIVKISIEYSNTELNIVSYIERYLNFLIWFHSVKKMTTNSLSFVRTYIQQELDQNNKILAKMDQDIKKCDRQLTALKILTTTLQLQMNAMKSMYHDVMELRKLIQILHPHTKTKRYK